MKIGFFELKPWEKEVVQKHFPREDLTFSSSELSIKKVKKFENLEAVAIFIHSKLDKNLLSQMPRLKLVTTMSTGYDHIDLEYCKKAGITVCNVPVYGENTVAEHTFALILGLSRKLFDCIERTRKGSFEVSGLMGFDLQGKILGVIGSGNIGQHVVRIAKGFEMKILVFDIRQDQKLAKKLGFKYVSLDKLLRESDIVTLHVPYNKHTHHLINSQTIKLMKKDAYLINTSRGGVVDTDALFHALKSKLLAGAGLDVLEEECHMEEEVALLSKKKIKDCNLKTIIENHKLLGMPNVLITPHNAFHTKEALMRILLTTIENIKKKEKVNRV